jgi:8-oxo-dGTP pyrophosphatase MutT (NUDIX family)
LHVVIQAGAIAVRQRGKQPEVVLVRSRRTGDWIFPKGHIEDGESADEAAVRELEEEAGVTGEALTEVGSSRFRFDGEQYEVTYYLVRSETSRRSPEMREVKWCRLDEARTLLEFADAQRLLDKAEKLIADTF